MVLAFLFNLAALVTVILWILHVGAKSTAKLLKVIATILLAIAGKPVSLLTKKYIHTCMYFWNTFYC